jgi:hypothetical protein
MSKSYENAQTNATTLFMSLLPLLVCINKFYLPLYQVESSFSHHKFYLPLYQVESSFSLPLCQQLTQKGIKLWREGKVFDGVD